MNKLRTLKLRHPLAFAVADDIAAGVFLVAMIYVGVSYFF